MKIIYCMLMILTSNTVISQPSASCNAPEASQFDFWIGEWELTWNDTIKGENSITKEMDRCVVYEHFSDPNGNYRGWSWSVFNVKTRQWQQTWVDNTGGYIALAGGMEGDKMILTTEDEKTEEGIVRRRMVFFNINKNSFDWIWEASTDMGKTWVVKWKIHYHRKE